MAYMYHKVHLDENLDVIYGGDAEIFHGTDAVDFDGRQDLVTIPTHLA